MTPRPLTPRTVTVHINGVRYQLTTTETDHNTWRWTNGWTSGTTTSPASALIAAFTTTINNETQGD